MKNSWRTNTSAVIKNALIAVGVSADEARQEMDMDLAHSDSPAGKYSAAATIVNGKLICPNCGGDDLLADGDDITECMDCTAAIHSAGNKKLNNLTNGDHIHFQF